MVTSRDSGKISQFFIKNCILHKILGRVTKFCSSSAFLTEIVKEKPRDGRILPMWNSVKFWLLIPKVGFGCARC